MRLRPKIRRHELDPRNESGAVLIITAVAMVAIIAMASFAIDTAFWYVHSRHLQTQADAAAFAGGQALAQGFEDQSCSDASITAAVHQYDGSSTYNQQVPSSNPQITYATSGSYTPGAHNLFTQVNQKNFAPNQTIPNDAGLTGHPCTDNATVDVKMTEANLPSFLNPFAPPYINKQAQVQAQTVQSGASAPFVVPEITPPGDAAVFVVSGPDKTPGFTSDSILDAIPNCLDNGGTSPCLTSSNGSSTWAATGVSVPFKSATASLVVATSTSTMSGASVAGVTTGAALVSFCSLATVTCYDSTDGLGLTYTRTYTASTPIWPAQPVIDDTSLTDSSATQTTACEADSTGLYTGFMTSSTNCSLTFTADINFGGETCSDLGSSSLNATLKVTASNGNSATLTCPNPGSTTAGSATGYWQTSTPIQVAPNAGPITFDLTWSRTGGGSTTKKQSWESGGSGTPAQCSTGNPCTNDFGIVQRVFTGAYDQNSATAPAPSGQISGAALTSSGAELMATPANTTVNSLGVTIDFQSLSNTAAGPGGTVPTGSYEDIAFGQNQGDGLAGCGQGVSDPPQQTAIAGGFVCTAYPVIPSSQSCATYTPSTNDCPTTVPGNKFYKWLDGGMATRIYGCPPVGNPGGEGATGCTAALNCASNPNYWDTSNQMAAVEANTSDPRLLTIMVTDPGNLAQGNSPVAVRHYAEFYVTGWTGDPCSGVAENGTNATNGLVYTSNDVPPTSGTTIFLVGHFIKDFQVGAVGSGTPCVQSALDSCTLTVTK